MFTKASIKEIVFIASTINCMDSVCTRSKLAFSYHHIQLYVNYKKFNKTKKKPTSAYTFKKCSYYGNTILCKCKLNVLFLDTYLLLNKKVLI